MEEFLEGLSLLGSAPEFEERIVELWLPITDNVLSSEYCNPLPYHFNRELGKILGLIIFHDSRGVITWKTQKWAPLDQFTDLINKWCKLVGHHPDCFPSLVGLLKSIGFHLMPQNGIHWLYSCICKINDLKQFFTWSRSESSLAELLFDSWSKQEELLRVDAEAFKKFVDIVDKLADYGDPIAIKLQSKIQ